MSEPAAPATAPGTPTDSATTSTATGEAMQALQAAVADLGLTPEQIKGRLEASRKWEDRAKSNADAAKRLAEVERSAMDEQQRAIADAVEATRAEVLAQVGATLVDAEVRAAAAALTAAGRPVDADALLEGDTLNRAAFLDADGKADAAKVASWLDKVAPKADAEPQQPAAPMWPDLGQGQRGPANKDMALNGDPLLRDVKAKLGID